MLARNDYVSYDPLLIHARDPADPVTLAFASAIGLARSSSRMPGKGGFGLDLAEFSALLDAYFPGARSTYITPAFRASLASGGARGFDEFEDLLSLLLQYRGDGSEQTRWLAYAITACCMGDDHLWQDMGLPTRQALSELLQAHFPELHARNTGGMRWKKFFYKQLCERNGSFVCRSPSCAVCSEYANCFGPEEDGAWQPEKR
ncbi:nitrogen fixation protein NifQ [Methyloterricola oryzae]|uniref:nitrogen fixation protein NifQ n=1 Tax=Methyloterricola oryzae TaxID=1495050 RepID=UPI0005EB6C58|nr:nitrogen fixation protein NifQ [Methyloterricola oryzae]